MTSKLTDTGRGALKRIVGRNDRITVAKMTAELNQYLSNLVLTLNVRRELNNCQHQETSAFHYQHSEEDEMV